MAKVVIGIGCFGKRYEDDLTAVFFKLVQCQPQLNREIQWFVVEGVTYNGTTSWPEISR